MINRNIAKFIRITSNNHLYPFRQINTIANTFADSKRSSLEKITKDGKGLESIIPEIKKPHESDGGIYNV